MLNLLEESVLELFEDELVLELSVEELEDEDEDCELTTFDRYYLLLHHKKQQEVLLQDRGIYSIGCKHMHMKFFDCGAANFCNVIVQFRPFFI